MRARPAYAAFASHIVAALETAHARFSHAHACGSCMPHALHDMRSGHVRRQFAGRAEIVERVRRDDGGRGGRVRTARRHRKTPCGQRRASGEGCDAMRYMLSLRTAGGMWMLMAGLEHFLCSMSAILCVSKYMSK